MKKYLGKLGTVMAFFLVMGLVFPNFALASQAQEIDTESKIYSNATMEDSFSEEKIMVVLNNDVSLDFDTYGIADFTEIACTAITDLSVASGRKIQAEMDSIISTVKQDSLLNRLNLPEYTSNVNPNGYKKVLCIELEDTGKDMVLEAIEALEKRSDIFYVGPDYTLTVDSSNATTTNPNDVNSMQTGVFDLIDLPETWSISTGSTRVTVGVIDTGIKGDHPDLEPVIDNNLCYDFTSGSAEWQEEVTDERGHGTKVAGIIGAKGNNGKGITGVCWTVRLASLKVLNSNGSGYASHTAAAIEFAEDNDIPILNLSASWCENDGGYLTKYDCALSTVISNYSGLLVCSAGNDKLNLDSDNGDTYPAEYNLPNMITVAASQGDDFYEEFWNNPNNLLEGTNYGEMTVDLFAPGDDIYTTVATGTGYDKFSGTSAAAPIVAGVAALLLAEDSTLTPCEIKRTIVLNVDTGLLDAGGDDAFGDYCISGGRINAYSALSDIKGHAYTYVNKGLYVGHSATCSDCGTTTTEEHVWTTYTSYYKCSKCLLTTIVLPIEPAKLPEDVIMQISLGNNSAVSMDENTTLCYIDGEYYLVKGYSGEVALQHAKGVINETATE